MDGLFSRCWGTSSDKQPEMVKSRKDAGLSFMSNLGTLRSRFNMALELGRTQDMTELRLGPPEMRYAKCLAQSNPCQCL